MSKTRERSALEVLRRMVGLADSDPHMSIGHIVEHVIVDAREVLRATPASDGGEVTTTGPARRPLHRYAGKSTPEGYEGHRDDGELREVVWQSLMAAYGTGVSQGVRGVGPSEQVKAVDEMTDRLLARLAPPATPQGEGADEMERVFAARQGEGGGE